MLKPRPYLFELIASLTKGEVAAFKRYAKPRNSFDSYLRLFDYLRRRKVYDEEKLKKDLRKESIIGYLAVSKNYLYNTILQFLSSPGGEDKEKDLYFRLMSVKKLMDKCLYHHALRIVKKAKQNARLQENFKVLLELLDLEKANNRQILDGKSLQENIHEIIREEQDTLEHLNQLVGLQHLYDQVSSLPRNRESVDIALDWRENRPGLSDPDMIQSTRGKILFWRTAAQIELRKGNFNGLVGKLNHCATLIENHPILLNDRPVFHSYLEILFNLGQSHLESGDVESGKEIARKLGKIQTDDDGKIRIAERRMVMDLSLAIQKNDSESGKELIQQISEEMATYQGRLHKAKELLLRYLAAHYLITMGMPSEANKWLQELLAGHYMDYRVDCQCFAELLFLIIQYEFDNREGLAYYHTNARNRLYRKGRLGPVEKYMLKFFRQMANISDPNKERELLTACHLDVEELYQMPEHNTSRYYFDFSKWAKSRLTGVPMAQLGSLVKDQL